MTLPKPVSVATLANRLDRIERRITALDGSRRLSAATISEGGLTVGDGGGIDIVGGGSLTITEGDLILGEGMIEGEALKNQISGSQTRNTASSFGVTNTGWQNKASASVSVPSWATSALVIATGMVKARVNINGEGEDSDLNVRVNIAGDAGGEMSTFPVGAGGQNYDSATSATWSATIDNPGSSFTVAAQARAARAVWYPSNSANRAAINALVIFLR